MEIKLKLLDNQQQSYKICLIGEGVIPRIELITPYLKQPKIGSIHFPVTCLGSTSQRFISFKNIVSCKCIVLLNIVQQVHDEKLVFWLAIDDSCTHMLIRNDLGELLKLLLHIKNKLPYVSVCLPSFEDFYRRCESHKEILVNQIGEKVGSWNRQRFNITYLIQNCLELIIIDCKIKLYQSSLLV